MCIRDSLTRVLSLVHRSIPTPILRKEAKRVMLHETDKTKDMTTPQLQRVVLLQQMELQKIQIEKQKNIVGKFKKMLQ